PASSAWKFAFRKRQGSGSPPTHVICWHRRKAKIAPEMAENKGACASWRRLSAAADFTPESGQKADGSVCPLVCPFVAFALYFSLVRRQTRSADQSDDDPNGTPE